MTFNFVRLVVPATSILLALNGSASTQSSPAEAAAKPLPIVGPLLGDNMILQRGKANTICGWSEPGDHVQTKIGEQVLTAWIR